MVKIKLTKSEFKDKELFERVNNLYSKLSKKDLRTLLEWVSVNCDVVQGNKCDECSTELEKDFIMTEFNLPVAAWVCPKSEIYQLYKKEFKNKYHKK